MEVGCPRVRYSNESVPISPSDHMTVDGGFGTESWPIAAALVKHLREEWAPPSSVKSEKLLDAEVLSEVRRWINGRIPEIPEAGLKQWVAGHEEEKAEKKWWTQSKERQVVCLWGAGKTSDLFIYHPDGAFGLPPGGISLEIKYVSLNEKTGKADSYAAAISTTAGQLLASHERVRGDPVSNFWLDGDSGRENARRQGRAMLNMRHKTQSGEQKEAVMFVSLLLCLVLVLAVTRRASAQGNR